MCRFSYNVTPCYKPPCNNNKNNAFRTIFGKTINVILGSCNFTKINSYLSHVTMLQMLLLNRVNGVTQFHKVFDRSQRARVCMGTTTQGYTYE